MDVCQEIRTEVEVRNVTVIFSGETGKEPGNKIKVINKLSQIWKTIKFILKRSIY